MNIPNFEGCAAARSSPAELQSAVVINFCDNEWPLIHVVTMFPVWIMEYHDLVIDTVDMRTRLAFSRLFFLHNQALLPVGKVDSTVAVCGLHFSCIRDWEDPTC